MDIFLASRKQAELTPVTVPFHLMPVCRCIDKWLRNGGNGKCPQCNCSAKRNDIRVIVAKAINVLDTSERDRALKELEQERGQMIKCKSEMAQALLEVNLLRSERDKLKEEVQDLRMKLETASSARFQPVVKQEAASGLSSDAAGHVPRGKYTLLKNMIASQVG